MIRKLFFIIFFLTWANTTYADSLIQRVSIEPLTGGVSFNTVTTLYKSWITAPSVEMLGRKEMSILNTSMTANLYLTGVSGSTATGVIYPREERFFKAASGLHIYASGDSVTFITTEIR